MTSSQLCILLVVLLPVATAIFRRIRNRALYDLHNVPGPYPASAHWLWGHELEVFEHEATETYSNWAETYGPLFKINAALFQADIIVAADHAAVQHIFADTTSYVKSPAFRPPIANILGKGIVWAEGDEHALQRRLLAPAFTLETVKGMADVISDCAERLETRLTNAVLSNSGETTINVLEHVAVCTLDIIGRVAFGHDFNSGTTDEAKEIQRSWDEMVNSALKFNWFVAGVMLRAFPFIASFPVEAMQRQGEIKVIVGRIARKLIEKHMKSSQIRRQMEGSKAPRQDRDILSILLDADADGGVLSSERIVDNMVTFIMVGHETTAGTLSFTLCELARRPEKQRRLREEILKHGGNLGYDDVQKLEYLDAVVKEGLRLHPASPQTERVATKDDIIPLSRPIQKRNGGFISALSIKKGQVFHIPFQTMQTSRTAWGINACEFEPERWIEPGKIRSPNELPHGWSNLVAFCDGPRNCLGYRLAIFEFKVILATLVRSLEFYENAATARVQAKILQTLQPVVDGQGGLLPLNVRLAVSRTAK